ncbi:1530_t:CDS:2 [Funneliformis geosporum]|uniref:1530_t:CDS:1 n=1 Tax=Funneliformis geosporum TaxID=1117311 RepID=A0A9W4SVD8_9GLOM|nr:1530_t:CDS:2 [Funneliformis geosporum]
MFKNIVRNIFLEAENANVKKYVKQISGADKLDPIIVIKPNPTWVANYGWIAYNNAMDQFAIYNLNNNQRRDKNSRCIFHFRDIQELHTVQDGICNRNLIPNGFHVPQGLQANIALGTNNPVPIGRAYLVINLEIKKLEFLEDKKFFYVD